jgi:hypothetical protein
MSKNWIAYVVLVLAIVVAGMLGVNYPVPAPPDTPVFEIVGNTRGASIAANGFQFDPSLKKITGLTGSALTMNSGSTFTGAGTNTFTGATALDGGLTMDTNKFTVADTSGNTVIAGSLAANGGIAVDTSAFTVADTSGNTVIAGSLAANGGIAVDTSAFTVADSSGNTAIAGTLGVTGAATFNGKVVGAPSGWITLADGFTLVPTATVQLVQSAGAVGGVVGTSGATAGQILYIVNKGSQNVVVTDTATCMLSGDLTLGQYDSLTMVFDGTNWIEVGTVNN